MCRPTLTKGTGKKQKLGTSESAFSRSTFVAAPSKWSVPSAETLAWLANRPSQSVGSSLHKRDGRQDDSQFHKRHTPTYASPFRPDANPMTKVRGSPTYRQNPTDDSPFRPNAAPTTIVQWSPTYRTEPAKVNLASPVARNETHTPGPERQMPVLGDESNMPTSDSTAVALHPPPASEREDRRGADTPHTIACAREGRPSER